MRPFGPVLSSLDLAYHRLTDAVLVSNISLDASCISYLIGDGGRNFRPSNAITKMGGPFWQILARPWMRVSSFFHHIPNIVSSGPQKQMGRPDAFGIVARVKHVDRVGYFSVLHDPSYTMSQQFPREKDRTKIAVPLFVTRPSPKPAIRSFAYFLPKSFVSIGDAVSSNCAVNFTPTTPAVTVDKIARSNLNLPAAITQTYPSGCAFGTIPPSPRDNEMPVSL